MYTDLRFKMWSYYQIKQEKDLRGCSSLATMEFCPRADMAAPVCKTHQAYSGKTFLDIMMPAPSARQYWHQENCCRYSLAGIKMS